MDFDIGNKVFWQGASWYVVGVYQYHILIKRFTSPEQDQTETRMVLKSTCINEDK